MRIHAEEFALGDLEDYEMLIKREGDNVVISEGKVRVVVRVRGCKVAARWYEEGDVCVMAGRVVRVIS